MMFFAKQKLVLKPIETEYFINTKPIEMADNAQNVAYCFWDLDEISYTEQFSVLYLNRASMPIAFAEIAKGGIDLVGVDIRVIFANALLCGATSLIIFHNHPSGNLNPSQSDKDLTNRIRQAGEILNIRLNDHIILTPQFEWFSFNENNLI